MKHQLFKTAASGAFSCNAKETYAKKKFLCNLECKRLKKRMRNTNLPTFRSR